MENLKVLVKIVTDREDVLPRRSHPGDAGYDLFYSGKDVDVPTYTPGSGSHIAKLPTGICIQCPPDCYIRVAPRSGLAIKGIVVNGGVVDPGYTGEISVIVMNFSGDTYRFKSADRIAQIVFERIETKSVQFVPTDSLGSSERGTNGFGSSDQ